MNLYRNALAFLFAIFVLPMFVSGQDEKEEETEDLAPEVQQLLDKSFKLWSKAIEEPRKEHERGRLEAIIEEIQAATDLTDEDAKPLVDAIDKAIEQGREVWIEEMREYMKTMMLAELKASGENPKEMMKEAEEELANVDEKDMKQILQSFPEPKNGKADAQEAWKNALAEALTDEQMDVWKKELAAKKAAQDQQIDLAIDKMRNNWRTPIERKMAPLVEAMEEAIQLGEDREEEVQALVEKVIVEVLDEMEKTTRKTIEGLPPQQLQMIPQGRISFGTQSSDPLESEAWKEGLSEILTVNEEATWDDAFAEYQKEVNEKMDERKEKVFKTQLASLRMQYTRQFDTVLTGIENTIEVDEEIRDQFKALQEEVLDAFEEKWVVKAEKHLETIGEQQAEQMLNRGYFGMALDQEDLPMNAKAWDEGLKDLLGEQFETWQLAKDRSDKRQRETLGRLMLAKMVSVLGLTPEQREKLLPVLSELGAKRYPPENFRGRMFSFSSSMFYHIMRDDQAKNKVAKLLEGGQEERWQAWIDSQANSRRSFTVKRIGDDPEPTDDALYREEALSIFLAHMRKRDRSTYLNTKLAKIEDMSQVLDLTDEQKAELTTAAKGTVELAMRSGTASRAQSIRSSISDVERGQVYSRLRNLGGNQFSYSESAKSKKIWESTVARHLDERQMKVWEETLAERKEFEEQIIRQQLLAQTERILNLGDEQVKELAPLFDGVLEKYGPDLESRFRGSSELWYYNAYYSLSLIMGIDKKKFKELLTEKQHERWKGEYEQRMGSY
ncbi:MAG: hypothetical protein AAF585_15620, partial [Verrucomicrobiota bacterium]